MTRDELEQRLWELEYGLLSEDEASALRTELDADPELRRLHDKILANAAIVAKAARIDGPTVSFRPMVASDSAVDHLVADSSAASITAASNDVALPTRAAASVPRVGSARIRRLANLTIGIATVFLVGVLGWYSFQRRGRDTADATPNVEAARPSPVLIEVAVPAKLSTEASNSIFVKTMTKEGTPKSVELGVQLENQQGATEFAFDVATDQKGNANVILPSMAAAATDAYRLKLVPRENAEAALQVDLAAADSQYRTHVSTDKPRYRPGEAVRFRSVTLSRFSLKADQDHAVEFAVTDPSGAELEGFEASGVTQLGVANGEFALPEEAAAGQYTVLARSPSADFPPSQSDFIVLKPHEPKYRMNVEWSEPVFDPGDTAEGKLAVKTLAGESAADVVLNFRAYVDGSQADLVENTTRTDSDGNALIRLNLPSQISSAEAELGVDADQQPTIWFDVPVRPNHVLVDFLPEGGELVAGLENRVYFAAHDQEQRPISIRGRLVDDSGQLVAPVESLYEGRGRFRFQPLAGHSYSLAIDEPAGIQSRPSLVAESEAGLVVDAGDGVFAGNEPISLTLRSQHPPQEFNVTAVCRGVTVGQRIGRADEFNGSACQVEVPVIPETSGVVRVTVFDYSSGSAEPLAERLVFRQPPRQLNLRVEGLAANYRAAETVEGRFKATDETGNPVAAVLGISVVDDSVALFAKTRAPSLPTRHYLWNELRNPERLEDANFYLAGDSTALTALDLLLGTEGWRRFERLSESQLAQRDGFVQDPVALSGGMGGAGVGRAAGFQAGVPTDSSAQAGFAGVAGRSFYAEMLGDTPLRFDNREELERAQPQASPVPRSGSASTQPSRRSAKPFPWPVVGLLMSLVVAAAIVRTRPTRRTALAVALVAVGVMAVITVGGLLRTRSVAVGQAGAESAATAEKVAAPEAEIAPEDSAEMTESIRPFGVDVPAASPADPSSVQNPAPRSAEKSPQSESPALPVPQEPMDAPALRTFPAPAPAPAPASPPAPAPPPAPSASSKSAAGPQPVPEMRKQVASEAGFPPAPVVPTPAADVPPPPAPSATPAAPQTADTTTEPKAEPARAVPLEAESKSDGERSAGTQRARQSQLEPKSSAAAKPLAADAMKRSEQPDADRSNALDTLRYRDDARGLNAPVERKLLPKEDAPTENAQSEVRMGMPGMRADIKQRFGEGRKTQDFGTSSKQIAPLKEERSLDETLTSKDARESERRVPRDLKSGMKDQETMFEAFDGAQPGMGRFKKEFAASGENAQWFRVRLYAHQRPSDKKLGDLDYAEMLYWHPLLITDEQGQATIRFDLPDTPANFRVHVDAHADGRVGSLDHIIESKNAEPRRP